MTLICLSWIYIHIDKTCHKYYNYITLRMALNDTIKIPLELFIGSTATFGAIILVNTKHSLTISPIMILIHLPIFQHK